MVIKLNLLSSFLDCLLNTNDVTELVDMIYSVGVKNINFDEINQHGRNLLLEILMISGVNMNIDYTNIEPLLVILLDRTSNINHRDHAGNTALIYAASQRKYVEIILRSCKSFSIDPFIKNEGDKDAHYYDPNNIKLNEYILSFSKTNTDSELNDGIKQHENVKKELNYKIKQLENVKKELNDKNKQLESYTIELLDKIKQLENDNKELNDKNAEYRQSISLLTYCRNKYCKTTYFG
jgi:ankyrin repeat protein